MPPNASEPESGSVMAQAPILARVSRSRPHRSFCSMVPRFMIVPAARPRLTPTPLLHLRHGRDGAGVLPRQDREGEGRRADSIQAEHGSKRLFGSLRDLQSKGLGDVRFSDPAVLPTSMIKAMTWADRGSAQDIGLLTTI